MFTQKTSDENKEIFEAAKIGFERLNYDPNFNYGHSIGNIVLTTLQNQFPNIPHARLRHQISRVMMKKRGEVWRKENGTN